MEFKSCFDIIGPVMVGPSSSHTAGAVSIGKFVFEWLGGYPHEAQITLYESFARTYQGHGTDKALLGGLLGMKTDDIRIRHAPELAEEQNMVYSFALKGKCPYFDHPNVAMISAQKEGLSVTVGGASIGGGLSKIFIIDNCSVDVRLSPNDDIGGICKELQTTHEGEDDGTGFDESRAKLLRKGRKKHCGSDVGHGSGEHRIR